MKTAIYTNRQLNESITMHVEHIGQAWELAPNVCTKMNWNINMFAEDVKIAIA